MYQMIREETNLTLPIGNLNLTRPRAFSVEVIYSYTHVHTALTDDAPRLHIHASGPFLARTESRAAEQAVVSSFVSLRCFDQVHKRILIINEPLRTLMVDETPTARAALLRWCDFKRRELDPLAMRQIAFVGKSLTFQSTTTAAAPGSSPSSSSASASASSVDIRRACRLEIPRRQSFEPKVTIESTYTCEVQRPGGGGGEDSGGGGGGFEAKASGGAAGANEAAVLLKVTLGVGSTTLDLVDFHGTCQVDNDPPGGGAGAEVAGAARPLPSEPSGTVTMCLWRGCHRKTGEIGET